MKATFNRKSLLEALLTVAPVVPSRSPKPILMNFKLSIEDDVASVMGTDLEVAIHRTVLGATVRDDGGAILPADRFLQILRTSTADEIEVETRDDKLIVVAGRSKFSLPNEDPTLFPELPGFAATNYMEILGENLKRLIRRASFATDPDNNRYALGGVMVEREAESLGLVGTDGRRLAKATCPAEWSGEVDGSAQCILPVKALKLIDKAVADEDRVHFAVEIGTSAMFRSSDSVISTRLVEGRFPRYQDIFPKETVATIPLDVAAFRSAIEQASIVANEESRGVSFRFADDGVELSCQAADVGESRVEMPLLCSMGAAIEVSMDPRYTLESLRTLEPGTPLVVDLVDGKNPVVFKSGDDYTYVVMPLTRD